MPAFVPPNLLNDDGTASMSTMILMSHHAFRRDLSRFRAALATIAGGDASREAAVRDEWKFWRGALHGHHEMEATPASSRRSARSSRLRRCSTPSRGAPPHRPLLQRGDSAFEELPNARAAIGVVARASESSFARISRRKKRAWSRCCAARRRSSPPSDAEAAMYADGFPGRPKSPRRPRPRARHAAAGRRLAARRPRARFEERCERTWGPNACRRVADVGAGSVRPAHRCSPGHVCDVAGTSSVSSMRAVHRDLLLMHGIPRPRQICHPHQESDDGVIRESGHAVGVLAYEGDVPVGWCSVAPAPKLTWSWCAPGRCDAPRRKESSTWTVLCSSFCATTAAAASSRTAAWRSRTHEIARKVRRGLSVDSAGISSTHRGHSSVFAARRASRQGTASWVRDGVAFVQPERADAPGCVVSFESNRAEAAGCVHSFNLNEPRQPGASIHST